MRYDCIFYVDSFLFSLHYKYVFVHLKSSKIDIVINMYSSYTAFGDLEIFLHGLGLEHMTDLLKVKFCISYSELYMHVYLLVNVTLNINLLACL